MAPEKDPPRQSEREKTDVSGYAGRVKTDEQKQTRPNCKVEAIQTLLVI